MMTRRVRTAGAGVLEFTLVGIPMIFLLISTFEMSRGMWMYHTLAAGVKEGVRYSIVHGQNCTISPNTCGATISTIATKIKTSGTGLPASDVTLYFTDASGGTTTCTLANCIANYTTSYWPNSTNNAPGLKVKISGIYPFKSTLVMFWPGSGGALGPSGTVNLSAMSMESIQY